MTYSAKGIVTAIGDVKYTKLGTEVQQIHFEQENGRIIYPSALGDKIEILESILPGDVIEIDFTITGSKGQYNNIVLAKVRMV